MSGSTVRRDIVLVVDDSPEALGFLTGALEQANITALVAIDGATALDEGWLRSIAGAVGRSVIVALPVEATASLPLTIRPVLLTTSLPRPR